MNVFGYHFSGDPFLSINASIVATARNILQKKVVLNEYGELFHAEPDEGEREAVESLLSHLAPWRVKHICILQSKL